MSLGLKICERRKVLQEALRILRPGGRLVVLESKHSLAGASSHPSSIYELVRACDGPDRHTRSCFCLPISTQGMENFPSAEEFAQELDTIGFVDTSFERLTLGIVAIHIARKPEAMESDSHRRA